MDEIMEMIESLVQEDKKTLEQKGLKCCEEAGELVQAILSYGDAHGCGYKELGRDDILEECADTAIVALSIIYHLKGNKGDVETIMRRKLDKWKEKISA